MAELEGVQNTLASVPSGLRGERFKVKTHFFTTDMHYQFCYRLEAKFHCWVHTAPR
jgi:hypothetical protein